MSVYCARGTADTDLSPLELQQLLTQALAGLGTRNRVLAVPPDGTREHSRAGELTRYIWEYYRRPAQRRDARAGHTHAHVCGAD